MILEDVCHLTGFRVQRTTNKINRHASQRLTLSKSVFHSADRGFNSHQDFSHLSETGSGEVRRVIVASRSAAFVNPDLKDFLIPATNLNLDHLEPRRDLSVVFFCSYVLVYSHAC